MAQAVMPKASQEAISIGCALIVAGLLEILGINDNKTISGISNCIPSPSNIRYMVKKSREATFMRIAGFVWKYPYIMSYNKGERAGLGCLVKEIAFYDGEHVQLIKLDADAPKWSSEEVAMSLDV